MSTPQSQNSGKGQGGKSTSIRRVNIYSYARLITWFSTKTVKECLAALECLMTHEKSTENCATRASVEARWIDQRGVAAFRQLRQNPKPDDLAMTNQNLAFVVAARGISLGGSCEILQKMDAARIPLNLVDCYGQTPLFYAARECDADSCKFLIDAKCLVDRVDNNNETCIFYAVCIANCLEADQKLNAKNRRMRYKTIALLLNEGCSFQTVNASGRTIEDVAHETGDPGLLKFLKKMRTDIETRDVVCMKTPPHTVTNIGAKRTQESITSITANKRPRLNFTIDGDEFRDQLSQIERTRELRLPMDHREMMCRLRNVVIPDFVPGTTFAEKKYFYCCSTIDSDLEDKDTFTEKERILHGETQTIRSCPVGISCKKGRQFNTPNQDSFVVFHVPGMFSLYGVFDGHGTHGHIVSEFVKEILPKLFLCHCKCVTHPEVALKESFINCQKLIEVRTRSRLMDAVTSGTTATLIYRPYHEKHIIVAHVGNSLAALIGDHGRVVSLAQAHRPENPLERHRIEEHGGSVVFDGSHNFRVYSAIKGNPVPTPCSGYVSSAFCAHRYDGGLNMSRSLGDIAGSTFAGITEIPTIARYNIDKDTDQFVCLCTNGVWEFLSPHETADEINQAKTKYSTAQSLADAVVQKSYDLWMKDEADHGCGTDDITALLIAV